MVTARAEEEAEEEAEEQAEAMNLLMLSDSPALNITGRPGTGKTTVAQFAVPEVLLQPGPKRRDRRILYLTTTHELKSEARREVRNIIRHVYGLSGRQFDSLLGDVQKLVKFQTRDNLISSDPREEEAFESESDIERIANEANEVAKLMSNREKSEWTRIHNNWLKDKGRRSELKRVIKNLVFGLFGSIDEYVSWYDGVTDKREKKGVWREIFHNMSLNLYKPWETKFDEESLVKGNTFTESIKKKYSNEKIVTICADIEDQIMGLDNNERETFMKEIGLNKTGLNQLIKEGYDLLSLDTFFTSGPEESRAWTVEKNTLAPKAASVIHTDFEKNFIRAEAVTCEDFIKFGSAEKCKENGKLRIEGKDYLVKDGDVLHFRVNS